LIILDEILALYRDLHDSLGANEICKEFCVKIIQVIQDAVDAIPSGTRVGIRCADPCAEYLIEKLDLSRTNVIGVFDLGREGSFCGYPLFLASKLKDMDCDYVIPTSYTYRNDILKELRSYDGHVIDIYQLLSEHEIELRGPIYIYQAGMPLMLNYFYLNYLKARGKFQKEKALRDFLQAAVENKDFTMISKAYEENGGTNGQYPILIETWKKAQRLLEAIQAKVNERQQKDIIVFWTDAISYFDLDDMPGIRGKEEEGCFFERFYSSAPWTHPVMQAIFQKLLPIDGFPDTQKRISRLNSSLIQYLEDKGYEFRWVSYDCWSMDGEYVVSHQIKDRMSNSVVWWYGLQSLLRSNKPCFYIFHFLAEGHEPMLAPDLVKFDLSRPNPFEKNSQSMTQRKTVLAYLDHCLMLYNQIFKSKDQIFFSDHGGYWCNLPIWSENQLHVYCLILGDNVPARRIQKFCSHENFEKLVRWLVEPKKYSLDEALSAEAITQDVDYYGEALVNNAIAFFKKGYPLSGISFRCIHTGNYKYVINALGEEQFYIINEDGTETLTSLEDDALRTELRNKCGIYFIDIRKHDKFKYSRNLYKSILHDHPELGSPLWATGES